MNTKDVRDLLRGSMGIEKYKTDSVDSVIGYVMDYTQQDNALVTSEQLRRISDILGLKRKLMEEISHDLEQQIDNIATNIHLNESRITALEQKQTNIQNNDTKSIPWYQQKYRIIEVMMLFFAFIASIVSIITVFS